MRISILRGFGNDATVIDFSKLFHLQAASCNWERYLYYIYIIITHTYAVTYIISDYQDHYIISCSMV